MSEADGTESKTMKGNLESDSASEHDLDIEIVYEDVFTPSAAAVFGNDVVWRVLGSYLGVDDLKCIRLVSKSFNRKVLDSTNFKTRTVFSSPWDEITRDCTKEKWKNIRMRLNPYVVRTGGKIRWEADLYELQFMLPYLDEVENIKFKLLHKVSSQTKILDFCQDSEAPEKISPTLSEVLQVAKNLKKISVEVAHSKGVLKTLNVFQPMEEVTSKLRELEFIFVQYGGMYEAVDAGVINAAFQTIGKFAAGCRNLQTFAFQRPVSHSSMDLELIEQGMECLAKCTEHNRESLMTVELNDPVFGPVMGNCLASAPVTLKSFKFSGRVDDADVIVNMLRTQTGITQLDLDFDGVFPNSVLKSIQKNANALKSIRIAAGGFQWDTRNPFEFFRGTRLEEFQLEFRSCIKLSNEQMSSFFVDLPPTLKVLCVSGIKRLSKIHHHVLSPELSHFDPLRLTALNLSRSDDFICNATVQYVIKTFKMLQKLDLSYAACTDEAFTGVSSNVRRPGAPISELNGLMYLSLKKCPISDQTLAVLKFLNLRTLDLSGCQFLSARACGAMVQQNPSLQVLRLSVQHRNIGQLNKRLKCVQEEDGGVRVGHEFPNARCHMHIAIVQVVPYNEF